MVVTNETASKLKPETAHTPTIFGVSNLAFSCENINGKNTVAICRLVGAHGSCFKWFCGRVWARGVLTFYYANNKFTMNVIIYVAEAEFVCCWDGTRCDVIELISVVK